MDIGTKFCTAINCMDGRTQIPVIEYLNKKYDSNFVDMITEPGPIKYLAEQDNEVIINSINSRINISISKHGSKNIAVVGHHDCAGNPISKEEQIKQILKSVEYLKSKFTDIKIIGLWVNENWEVEEIP
jgi:hypothetical protein